MKLRIVILLSTLVVFFALKSVSAAQEQTPPLDIPTNMKPYFLVLVLKGPNFQEPTTEGGRKLLGQHLAWIRQMNKEKKLFLAGPLGKGRALGMAVVAAGSEEEAKKLMDAEPEVKAKAFSYEIQSVFLPNLDSVKFEYSK